jgi:CheY-like chemotaxis protein
MKTVLLVEDDVVQRRLMMFALRPLGIALREAASAEEASPLLDGADLLITDHTMPGRTGLELVAELRGRAAAPPVPAILLTGRGEPSIAEEAQALGHCALVAKPFSPSALAARVRELLGL